MTKPLTALLRAMIKPLTALLLAAVTLAAAPTAAHAGSYALVACADLAGALGPGHVVRPADGWFLEQGVYPSGQQCSGGLFGRGIFATGSRGSNLFRLNAPTGTSIARLYTTYRAHLPAAKPWAVPTFVVQAGHPGGWEYIGPARGWIGARPIDFSGRAAGGNAHGAQALRVGTRCGGPGPCEDGGPPVAEFRALAVVLTDDAAPTVGLRAPAGHMRGTVGLQIEATDEGGGVFERSLSLDGRQLAGGALCGTVPASVGAMRHVVRGVPCPLDASADVTLKTHTLADGPHALLARVEDVAGNARTQRAEIVVDNRPPRAGRVELAGEPALGEALSAQAAGFAGESVEYGYGWQRCDDAGGVCTDIGGALGRTYALRARDIGHRVRAMVSASDGGGTVRVASAPSTVITGPGMVVTGPPTAAAAPEGRLTAWLERGRRRLRRTTVRWPARVRIRGRLTALDGRPLARTPVRMLEQIDGRRRRPITGVRTRRDGRLTAFTRIGPSRRLRLVYGHTAVTLRLRVRARARVKVRRSRTLTIVSGRLLGGNVPRAGVRLRLQSRRRAGWSTRAVLRTDGLGRFSATGYAPSGVRLRVAIPRQSGYPFAPATARP